MRPAPLSQQPHRTNEPPAPTNRPPEPLPRSPGATTLADPGSCPIHPRAAPSSASWTRSRRLPTPCDTCSPHFFRAAEPSIPPCIPLVALSIIARSHSRPGSANTDPTGPPRTRKIFLRSTLVFVLAVPSFDDIPVPARSHRAGRRGAPAAAAPFRMPPCVRMRAFRIRPGLCRAFPDTWPAVPVAPSPGDIQPFPFTLVQERTE